MFLHEANRRRLANPLVSINVVLDPLLADDSANLAVIMDQQYSLLARGGLAPARATILGVPGAPPGAPPGFVGPAISAANLGLLGGPPAVGLPLPGVALGLGTVVPAPGALLSAAGPASTVFIPTGMTVVAGEPSLTASYDHLIYAFMLENTKIVEIFRKVIKEVLVGERLPVLTNATRWWCESTEALFFSSGHFPSSSRVSSLRPDSAAIRRNAYFRLLGMELGHGGEDGSAVPFERGTSANGGFADTFKALLDEVRIGIDNANNLTGPNKTDVGKITDILSRLKNMLLERRKNGNLNAEEFWATAMMSWLHLAIIYNSPIVDSLGAQAQTSSERLMRLGQRVGVPAHSATRAYLSLARDLSLFLRMIEAGVFVSSPANVTQMFAPGGSALRTLVEDIMTQWTAATGTAIRPAAVAPLRGVTAA